MIDFLCFLIKNKTAFTGFILSRLNNSLYSSSLKTTLTANFNTVFSSEFLYPLFKYYVNPFLLFIVIVLVVLLIANRYGFEKKIQIKKEVEQKINDFLTEIIFSNCTTEEIKEKIKAFITVEVPFNKKWCREIILKNIITVKRNINGVNPNQMLLIYKYFGFNIYSDKLIKSRSWEKKLLGIYHYQILDYKIKKGRIRPNIYVKNKFLKSNALVAVISLSDEKFEFLNNYEKKIATADELKILDIIHQKKAELPKNINNWIYNKNSSIVTLAIKLMIRYRESLTKEQIRYLLKNENPQVRKETLLAIRTLYIIETSAILIDYYKTETEKRCQISALKTIGSVGDLEAKQFIVSILKDEKDLEIKFEIVKSIIKLDEHFFDSYQTTDMAEKEVIAKIILHVNTPYLN